jgi:hypothetical protein
MGNSELGESRNFQKVRMAEPPMIQEGDDEFLLTASTHRAVVAELSSVDGRYLLARFDLP